MLIDYDYGQEKKILYASGVFYWFWKELSIFGFNIKYRHFVIL